jgi:hypothetical protein
VLVANLTRPGINGVSVRVVGIRLGLQFSKTDDNHVNANGEFIGLKQRETLTNPDVSHNNRTSIRECIIDIQLVAKDICASFCASFMPL